MLPVLDRLGVVGLVPGCEKEELFHAPFAGVEAALGGAVGVGVPLGMGVAVERPAEEVLYPVEVDRPEAAEKKLAELL